ncbi:hypothetical protein F5B18DRAFT_606521 [Nemania serpens]|nr:hypothetical protein F5B18DRAFT_606521 [Nemania serpens]
MALPFFRPPLPSFSRSAMHSFRRSALPFSRPSTLPSGFTMSRCTPADVQGMTEVW